MTNPYPPPMRIGITGASGKIATALASHFQDQELFLFSRHPAEQYLPQHTLWEMLATNSLDLLIHTAWGTVPFTSEQTPGREAHDEIPYLRRVIHALRPGRCRLVFLSSAGTIYGNAAGRPSTEDDSPAPIGWYGYWKWQAERMIAASLPQSLILRLSNVYGFHIPEQRAQGLIPKAIASSLSQTPLPIWGDGTATKDYLHARDACLAVDALLRREAGGIFNVASGHSLSIHELLEMIESITGKPCPTIYQKAPAWDVTSSLVSNEKLATLTSWNPQTKLLQGLEEMAQSLFTPPVLKP